MTGIAVVLFFITCLLVAGGVSSYQFAILAIALPLLQEANLPKKVALAAMSAGADQLYMVHWQVCRRH